MDDEQERSTTAGGAARGAAAPSLARRGLLFATYFLAMFGINSAPSLYPSMEADGLFDAAGAARILGVQTAGTALGKLFAGPLADVVGGRQTYFLASTLLVGFVCLMSASGTAWLVGLAAFCMEMANTPIWPAHARIVHGWFPQADIADAFWVLSMASRGGNMAAGLAFGALVSAGLHWRWVLRLAAGCCAVGTALGLLFHKDSRQNTVERGAAPDLRALGRAGCNILMHRQFWMAAFCLMPATVVKRMGQAVSIYLFAVAPTVLDKGTAASVAVVYQVGLLTSVAVGGGLYKRISHQAQRRMLLGLGCISSVSAGVLAAWSNTESTTTGDVVWRAVLLFLVAMGIGCSYYIPTGIFSVKFGGKASTGTVSAFMDMVSWAIAATFLVLQGWVIDGPLGWGGVWGLVGCASALCAFTTYRLQGLLQSGQVREFNVATDAINQGEAYRKLAVEEKADFDDNGDSEAEV